MRTRLINRPCTLIVVTAGEETDDYGNQIPETQEIATVCELQQRQREEPAAAGELSRTDWDVFFPAGTVVRSGYKLRVDGELYELIGDGWEARSPVTRRISHVEASARRAGGDPGEEEDSS